MRSPVYPEVEMKQVVRFGITIDYCPKSGGVWLDKGELEKLIQAVESSMNSVEEDEDNVPLADFDRDKKHDQNNKHDSSYNQQKKKRSNPLEDIFDIFG